MAGSGSLTFVSIDPAQPGAETEGVSKLARTVLVALCLAGLAVNGLTLKPAWEFIERGQTDFMDLYAGGKLAFTSGLYVKARVLETEARTEGRSSETRLFLRLPCFALLYWPLAQLPYQAASVVWEGLCCLAAVAFAVLWPAKSRWRTGVACCWSLPCAMAVAEGQDLGFVLLAIAAAAWLLRRKRPESAGIAASLCLAKFHLFLLIPVWICARRQWRFARGLAIGCAALGGLSFLAGGWDWPMKYIALVSAPGNNPYAEVMPDLHAVLGGTPILEWTGVALLAAAVWAISRRANEWGLAAALAAGILVAPHAYMADGVLAIPAVLLVLKSAPQASIRAVSFYLLTPLPWVLLMTGNGMPVRLGLAGLIAGLAIYSKTSLRGISIPFARSMPSVTSSSRPGVAIQP
jgi:MYXO-CTERM domain-containing protein